MASLTSLSEMDFGTNQLSGQIPDAVGSWMDLERLGFSINRLSGKIPDAVGCMNRAHLHRSRHQQVVRHHSCRCCIPWAFGGVLGT